MSRAKTMQAGRVGTGFDRLVQNDSTAVSLTSTMRLAKGSILQLTVETNNVRYRDDGTDPTTNTGVLLPTGVVHEIVGYDGGTNLKFFRASGGTAIIQIMRYKYAGE